ncbi:heavy metal translocating P-type ATPase [Haploplasma axanthum]|uniref:Copper-exporting P-type ATPase A n=1 Tax=Haploplasma axanthum TaxID=29552 RepID=A0A449BEK4_HAPAX|nr:heavy metal translocating P-type ATPase [Haploplasma axanthum]VEU80866.1 Copper-exporting P-type ATPase A [Haploplasma axanthum]
MRKRIKVSNITCTNCAKTIEQHFNKMTDINAKVLVTSSAVIFTYDESKYNEDFLFDQLLQIGYYGIKDDEKEKKSKRKDLIDLVIAIIFTIPLLFTMFEHLGATFIKVPSIFMNGYFQWIMATPVLFISGRRFFNATWHSVKARNLGMDSLVVIGTTSAYLYSIFTTIKNHGHTHDLYFETTAVIILMVLIGNYFENRIKAKTSATLTGLLSLGAKEAIVIRNGIEVTIPIDDVVIDDIVIVKGYDKIPVDGIIIEGKTYVDESMLTGESMPVVKKQGDEVIGSSMNIMETIKIKVTKIGSETVLAKIIQTVEETSLIKPKAQRIADKISSIFVPIVVILSALVLIGYLVISKETFSGAISPAIAVLVVSCPCALGLATPTSISVSSGMAFKEGVLYKGGEFFEIANKITAIAFDKTGTLTNGKPNVTNYLGNEEYLKYTASLEKHSNHPIATSITKYYKDEFLDVKNFETLIGYGIKGIINKKQVYVVSISYINEKNLKLNNEFMEYEKYQEEGKTVFFTVIDNEIVNMIAVADELKPSSFALIKELKRRNITPYMITGDQEKTAKYIAGLLGIEKIYAKVLPHEKANIIQDIQKHEKVVAFVGDGINDAPALKMADVGFAIGTGADIAIDTADVTLMNNDLKTVLYAIDLSKATLRNIYLNFFWAFIYNIVMIPLAALGLFNPMLAGFGMAFSSIMVVLNALSLKLWKFKYREEIKNENN